MGIRRLKLKGGFTLVELMIVVAIVGVLAVLAVYGVRKYIANAKTAEAKNSLGQIGKDAVSAFDGERMSSAVLGEGTQSAVVRSMCQTGAAGDGVPAGIDKVKASKYQSSALDWAPVADVTAQQGWPCLRFEMSAPQYYMYKYAATGTTDGTFSTSAEGDLNGDGTSSSFTLNGSIQSGRLTLAPSIAEVSPDE